MTWQEVTLGECFTIKHGFAFKSQHFGNSGNHIVLTPGNFHEIGGFRSRPGKTRFYTIEPPDDFVLRPGDLVIAMTEQGEGLLGSSALIPKVGSYLHNQRIGLIENIDEQRVSKEFLYRLFNTPHVRGQIRASASGTKIRHTAPKRIYTIKVKVPPIAIQRKISGILSAYDDLIENNRRRTTLLEEAARLLYREWFVRFRFPGHEHIKIVDGLPEGWERLNLGEIATIKKGKNITKDTAEEGNVPVIAGGLNPAYYHNKANALSPVVTISASGANAGYVALYQTDIWASDCSFLSGSENLDIWFLYLSMESRQTEITGMQQGAAQPHVYPKHLERLNLVYAPRSLLELFHESVDVSFRQIANLKKQSEALHKARDLLLPRLMNGEVAV